MTQSGYVELDGGKLYYEMAGAGDPLVMTHAGFVDCRMWDAQWDVYAQHYRVIRYDMRGFGKSDPVKAPISRRDDLYRLLRHLDIQRAHLMGCSMGGTVTIDFALDHPEMVISLIPVSADPSGFEMEGPPPQELLDMFEATKQGDLERVSELQIQLWIDGSSRQPGQVDPKVRQHAAMMNKIPVQNNTWAMDMQPLDPLDPPAISRLHEIHAPTLIIDGALDHPEILRAADIMANGIKGAQKLIIQGTAHMPSMEKPDEFNRAVAHFLHK